MLAQAGEWLDSRCRNLRHYLASRAGVLSGNAYEYRITARPVDYGTGAIEPGDGWELVSVVSVGEVSIAGVNVLHANALERRLRQ